MVSDLSVGGVSVETALMASLAWQPHFFMALLFATSILCQLLVATHGISGLLNAWWQN